MCKILFYILLFDQQNMFVPLVNMYCYVTYILFITRYLRVFFENYDTYVFYRAGLSTAQGSRSGIFQWSQGHRLRHFDSHCCHTHLQTLIYIPRENMAYLIHLQMYTKYF